VPAYRLRAQFHARWRAVAGRCERVLGGGPAVVGAALRGAALTVFGGQPARPRAGVRRPFRFLRRIAPMPLSLSLRPSPPPRPPPSRAAAAGGTAGHTGCADGRRPCDNGRAGGAERPCACVGSRAPGSRVPRGGLCAARHAHRLPQGAPGRGAGGDARLRSRAAPTRPGCPPCPLVFSSGPRLGWLRPARRRRFLPAARRCP